MRIEYINSKLIKILIDINADTNKCLNLKQVTFSDIFLDFTKLYHDKTKGSLIFQYDDVFVRYEDPVAKTVSWTQTKGDF